DLVSSNLERPPSRIVPLGRPFAAGVIQHDRWPEGDDWPRPDGYHVEHLPVMHAAIHNQPDALRPRSGLAAVDDPQRRDPIDDRTGRQIDEPNTFSHAPIGPRQGYETDRHTKPLNRQRSVGVRGDQEQRRALEWHHERVGWLKLSSDIRPEDGLEHRWAVV